MVNDLKMLTVKKSNVLMCSKQSSKQTIFLQTFYFLKFKY